ncbi:hypothetical protein [uncultured Tissierella sp.]|uniref:hypothetical protein n=1 Tax=Tissierella sp. TaxID=41274 RepID=UPI0028044D34|nr:hypothetical protein [uncultured Tissierella sp.]MDU5082639.1 hypothetical protein [Bacillota bacterium]
MKKLEISNIEGLHNELYFPVDFEKLTNVNDSSYFFKNLNTFFWKEILSVDFIRKILKIMDKSEINELSVWEKAVLYNKKNFENNVLHSLKQLVSFQVTQEELFYALETLTLYCNLLSKYYFNPTFISIQEGIIGIDNSFSKLLAQVNEDNECKKFLTNFISPYLQDVDFIWINGTLKYSSLLVIKLLREINSELFVGLKSHDSEYFSYNKIEDYLQTNNDFFEYIDCIILDSSNKTVELVEENFKNYDKLEYISNIMFKNKNNNKIQKTTPKKIIYSTNDFIRMPYEPNTEQRFNISKIVNMRIFANKSCYWHKCAFCGINKKYKYQFNDANETFEDAITIINRFYNIGYKYFWFEDEAITKEDLIDFGVQLLNREISILWQARTRFDNFYSATDCQVLYNAGLREIRFGYESGDKDVLVSMNKYPEDFDYDIVEHNIKIFSESGIHVHLPTILGFPTETEEKKNKTINSLLSYNEQYDTTFNLNRFLLDVSSDAFKYFYRYNIYELNIPCTYNDFLGNFANYNYSSDMIKLDNERNTVMKNTLYPWMPNTSLLSPIIYYRLAESLRMTLLWAANSNNSDTLNDFTPKYELNKNISIIENGYIIIYIWDNHCIVKYDKDTFQKISSMDINNLPPNVLEQSINKKVII